MRIESRPPPRDAYVASDAPSRRQTTSALTLLAEAAGGPREWRSKARRVVRTASIVADRQELGRRLAMLRARGYIATEPTPTQLALLGIDMLRYFIEPGARDYYRSRGIDFSLHQMLRVLDDPCSMIDPIGLFSDRDVIIGHLLQVVHANPVYDLQLLGMFEDGLDELERQTGEMLRGEHERATSIAAIVEDPGYHMRLLDYVRRFRRDAGTPELRRRAGSARSSEAFVLAEETFGSMPSAFRYATRLPTTKRGAVEHLRTKRAIDPAYCDPHVAGAVSTWFARPISA